MIPQSDSEDSFVFTRLVVMSSYAGVISHESLSRLCELTCIPKALHLYEVNIIAVTYTQVIF